MVSQMFPYYLSPIFLDLQVFKHATLVMPSYKLSKFCDHFGRDCTNIKQLILLAIGYIIIN